MNRFIATGIALLVLVSGSTLTADADLKGVKCIMNGKSVDAGTAVDYKGGKVYFCCKGCAGKFAKDKEKYATKAN
ncbi:MAG: YHS domain-containing protein, partial [Planctomycetota bacterium]